LVYSDHDSRSVDELAIYKFLSNSADGNTQVTFYLSWIFFIRGIISSLLVVDLVYSHHDSRSVNELAICIFNFAYPGYDLEPRSVKRMAHLR